MNQIESLQPSPVKHSGVVRLATYILMCLAAAGLAACGAKGGAPKSGQALVSVDGEEITVSQLSDEMQRAGTAVAQAQPQEVTKQLLDSLVERQLIVNAAVHEHIDRDPEVVRAVERAKALLIAQAYMQRRLDVGLRPTAAEVDSYYADNPQFFAERKQMEMRQLVLKDDLTPEVKAVIDNAGTLDEVAAYLDLHKISYGHNQVTRSTADLPKEISAKLLSLSKGQLLLVREHQRSVLTQVSDVRDAPVSRQVAASQIQHYLVANRNQAMVAAEVARLRAGAKITYLNKSATPVLSYVPAAKVETPVMAEEGGPIARGVAGLK